MQGNGRTLRDERRPAWWLQDWIGRAASARFLAQCGVVYGRDLLAYLLNLPTWKVLADLPTVKTRVLPSVLAAQARRTLGSYTASASVQLKAVDWLSFEVGPLSWVAVCHLSPSRSAVSRAKGTTLSRRTRNGQEVRSGLTVQAT